eukprot:GFKZ01004672.1.p1 GENE.GFKZ01004672.1~~GFKZ01004672.1.p1  ORF type:complete len:248 (+),score=33.40 GFKZ01004672.1:27-746(+)
MHPTAAFVQPAVAMTSGTAGATPVAFTVTRTKQRASARSGGTRRAHLAAHEDWVRSHAAHLEVSGELLEADGDGGGTLHVWRASAGGVEDVVGFCAGDAWRVHGVYETGVGGFECMKWRCVISVKGGGVGFGVGGRWFMVWAMDRGGCAGLRGETRGRHLQWLAEEGRCLVGGPFLDEGGLGAVGSLLVVRGEGCEEVAEWARGDPYAQVGLFDSVDVREVQVQVVDGRWVGGDGGDGV